MTCPHCRLTFKIAARASPVAAGPPPAAAPAPPPAALPVESSPAAPPAPRRPLAPILLLSGVGVVLVSGLVVAAILFSQASPQAEPEPVPGTTNQQSPPAPPIPPPPPPDPRIKIVQPAVDRGVAFIKTKLPELETKSAGYAGLNGLALLECDVPADDPAVLRIAQIIRGAAPGMDQVYDLAASLFFLNRWHESQPLDEKDRATARTLALRLIAGQTASGIWSYGSGIMSPDQEAKLLTALRDGTYKPNGPVIGGGVSLSNTQFAMLAVWGARKHGVPVREPLLALAAYFHREQNPDGSWNYPRVSLKATSTCAGLIALAIEKALLEDREFTPSPRPPVAGQKRADVDKAFAFVARTIGRKKN